MSWRSSRTRLLVTCVACLCPLSPALADLPTPEEILAIHRANQAGLSQLHIQLIQIYETTEASCREAHKRAEELEQTTTALSKLTPEQTEDLEVVIEGTKLKGEPALQIIQQLSAYNQRELKHLRLQQNPYRIISPMELFLRGDDYQFRGPVQHLKNEDEVEGWAFPESPLTPESLVSIYRDIGIFSRSAAITPAARWWHHSVDGYAYVMQKHLTEVWSVKLPPYSSVMHPQWDRRHPIDAFFSQPAEGYRVVGQEEIEGRLMTIVDVRVPIANGADSMLLYRGWLDLSRGAVPVMLYHSQGTAKSPLDAFDCREPSEIMTTAEIRELANGGFYPTRTIIEEWGVDPDASELTEEQRAEVLAGKRKPSRAVHRRYSWDCSLIEVKTEWDDGFFVLPFPEGQDLFDHDAGKSIGALETKPLVQVGQPAPPLTIARWLDGKPRTLDDLKGQVVVLDFWGLWCGACRSAVPRLKEIQATFQGRPVTFVSIHSAERDLESLAKKIEKFATENDWKYLAAIDSGRKLDDSVTTTDYGIDSFPKTVIIGPDGKIVYVDPACDGPFCDEEDKAVLAAFERKMEAFLQQRFQAVGETWPLPENLDENERDQVYLRVERKYIVQQIEQALKSTR